MKVMIALDQLGNAISGGNPDITISSRVGYYSSISSKWVWAFMEWWIDLTFYPIDGPKHCYNSHLANKDEVYASEGKDVFKVIMMMILLLVLAPISIVIKIISLFSLSSNKD